jgi:hypothetical protein
VVGLLPYSSGAGERGGTVDNYEPEFTKQGGSQEPGGESEPEFGEGGPGDIFSDKTESQLQSSEEAYRQLAKRKDALVQERNRLLAARDELQGRIPPHYPDPYNILSVGLKSSLLKAEHRGSCLNPASKEAYVCPDCAKWRSERNKYILDCEQLKRDYDAENKKYVDALHENQTQMQNQVGKELEKHGGLLGMISQLGKLERQLREMERKLDNMDDTVEFYELQVQGAVDLISDLKSVVNECADTTEFYSRMQGAFLPLTIGINSHWMVSLWGSLKRILYRFENLDTMENLFPSLAIAGQRTRIMQMNKAIEEMLFSDTVGLDIRASQSGVNAIHANTSFALDEVACSSQPPSTYIKPYNDPSRPTDDGDPEPRFLALAGYTATPRKVFGRGWHTGNNKHGWFRRKNNEILGRYYKQENSKSANVAKWFFFTSRWLKIDLVVCKIIVPTYIGWGTESGNTQRMSDNKWFLNQKKVVGTAGYLTGTAALKAPGGLARWLLQDDQKVQRTWPRPHYLVKDKQWSSYSFAATAKVNNPFAFFGNDGWIKAFQIPNQIHAVSTATSGYRLPSETWAKGKTYTDGSGIQHHSNLGYRTWHSNEGSMKPGKVDMQKLWNLRVTDWDALLISAHDEACTTSPFDVIQPKHKAPAGMSGNTSHGGKESDIGNLGDQNRGALFDYNEGKTILMH